MWEESAALIFVHTEDQFKAHERGVPHLEPVGFPVEDVFRWESSNEGGNVAWEDLEPYRPVTA